MNLWERRTAPGRPYVCRDHERRKRVQRTLACFDSEVASIIEGLQPFYQRPDDIALDALGLMSRLDNADKHRSLINVVWGLMDPITVATIRGQVDRHVTRGLVKHGAPLRAFTWTVPPPLAESEVKVEVSGTPNVAFTLADVDGAFGLPESLGIILANTTSVISEDLEPYLPGR